jgi:hypothetical protein
MRAAPFQELETIDADEVVCWRFEALLQAGYDAGSALLLAGRADVDLHQAARLVERGCPPALALQILL